MASTINIPLPESLMAYVEAKAETGEYGTPGQYVRKLIENDRDQQLRVLERRLLDALKHEHSAIEVPDEVWDGGDIVGFLEQKAEQLA